MSKSQQLSDTQIVIENSEWKVRVYLGAFGLVAFVILAFVYRFEAGIIALSLGLAWAGRVAFAGYHRHKLAGYERRKLEAETLKAESEAVKAKAESFFVQTNSGVFVLDGIAVSAFYPAVSASKLLADAPMLLPETTTPKYRKLLDVEFIHLLVVGPSGSGKTTVLCHLIDNTPGNTVIYALDPHAQFGEWSPRVNEIVGNGRDYPAIDAKLLDLISTLNKRYNGLESTSQQVLIVADEWLSILDKCPNAREFFSVIGSEARKINMSLIISSISAGVDDLTVSGAIRDNLAQLTLSRTLKSQNQGELKWSRKDAELVELPGAYRRWSAAQPVPLPPPAPSAQDDEFNFDSSALDPGPAALGPDPDELRIYQLYQDGKSLRAIYTEIYGRPYGGGREVQELRAILGKFGVKFETDGDVAG